MDRVSLKTKAKESLKGKYGDAIALMVIYGLITSAASYICKAIYSTTSTTSNGVEITVSPLSSIASIVITCLFIFGVHSYYLKLSRNEKVEWKELFSKTDLFVPALIITLVTGIFIGLWSLLLIIPGVIAAIGYSQVYFIKLDNPDMKEMDVLKKSKELMNGHKMDYFVLCLSFIGWILLGVLTLGILYFWLIPYMSVTQANFYNELIKKK